MSPKTIVVCGVCGKPLSLTSTGKLRKGKKYCSTKCQQTAIKELRQLAREDLAKLLESVEPSLKAKLVEVLHVLGMV